MNKFLALTLALVLVLSVGLVGCSAPTNQTTTTEQDTTTVQGEAKLGLGIVASTKDSKAPGEEAGLAKTSAMLAAVLVDQDGKVIKASIDAIGVEINFDQSGKLLTATDKMFASKRELGDDYGMKKASGIAKEWYEQADFFENYIVGKTLDEIKGIAIDGEGKAGDADLKAGITVHIGSFIAVVEKAMNNAVAGSSANDMLGLALQADIGHSKDVADKDGVAEASITVIASTFDKDGKVSNDIIDVVQGKVTFDATGQITSDVNAPIKSKLELGDDYGMKKASGIGKEWHEQATAFSAYVTGKTIEEINGIALDKGVPADDDLKASVTIHVSGFQKTLEKAFANKK